MDKIRLWGAAEIRRRLNDLSENRIYVITSRRDFPEPVAELEMGRVWAADEVEEWIRVHRPNDAQQPDEL
jgi:predicted DNA-binding transcriptional regulator AlpA